MCKELSSAVYIHDTLINIHVGMYYVYATLWNIIALCFENICAVTIE